MFLLKCFRFPKDNSVVDIIELSSWSKHYNQYKPVFFMIFLAQESNQTTSFKLVAS